MTPDSASYGADAAAAAGTSGCIPFSFRIGVTGHRRLADPDALIPAVNQAIRGVTERLLGAGANPPLLVISMLAEGADRLVARLVLTLPGTALEAVLPLPRDEYLKDFATEESRGEFDALVRQAGTVWQATNGGKSREDGYERAGRQIVDRSDAVIALWDREPARGRGGTATIVAYAREQGVPLVVVPTAGDPARLEYRIDGGRVRDIQQAVREFRRYNGTPIRNFPRMVARQRSWLDAGEPAGQPESFRQARDNAAGWVVPYFVRADTLATRLERYFQTLSAGIFLLAAVAVTVVVTQVIFAQEQRKIIIAEVVLLLALLVVTLIARRQRLLHRWIDARFLAERLRSSYYLALIGTGDWSRQPARRAYLSDPSETWIQRALIEISARRPDIVIGRQDIPALRDYLSEHWIGGQIRYHSKAAGRQVAWEARLFAVTGLLFTLTVVAAVLHVLEVGTGSEHMFPWEDLIIVLSISLPAIGAAVHGIRTQAQFRRQSERYARMAGLLEKLKSDMVRAQTLPQIREVASAAENLMREENNDWFGAMRFHDVELVTLQQAGRRTSAPASR